MVSLGAKCIPFAWMLIQKTMETTSAAHSQVSVKKRIILGICSVRCTQYIYCTEGNKENSMRCVLCVCESRAAVDQDKVKILSHAN